MIEARQQILASVRRALGRDQAPADRAAIEARLAHPVRGPRIARGQGDPAELVQRFIAMASEASATIERVASDADVPAALADFLARENLPARIAASPALAPLDWSARPLLEMRFGPPEDQDVVSLTPAQAGIAETGTLMLLSGPDTPSTLAFLPAVHVAILHQRDIVGGYEDGWDRMRSVSPGGKPPRSVNFITGPSRTADIEQRLLLGAHGPRRLHILLIDG
jgi:L-lactate dehydrogenase complex protein LldG